MNGSAGTAAALGALLDRWDREAGPIPEADRAAARAAFDELDGRADDPDQGP